MENYRPYYDDYRDLCLGTYENWPDESWVDVSSEKWQTFIIYELAFYDALTKSKAIKDFYENEELIAITKELADSLRRNRTIDWQKRDSARAKMRMMIRKLLKKHKYPPEGMDDAVQTVMLQCELWTDNNDMEDRVIPYRDRLGEYAKATYDMKPREDILMVAEKGVEYGKKAEED